MAHPRHSPTTARPQQRWALLAVALSTLLWIAAFALPRATAAASEPVEAFQVIVHPSNDLRSTTRDYVAQVFFKRITRWSNGQAIRPVDLRPDSAVRRAFSDSVLKRSVDAVRNFWQQRIFSGRELPPPELDSDDAVIRYVANSPGAIGYVSAHAKPSQTKLLTLE